jgi:organic hydroperoxide reductase OsmC/OhrA
MKLHNYSVRVQWTGNEGQGTQSHKAYRRDHTITSQGKPPILASSDPAFRGDPARYNPEDLLVASLSGCHMLWYLHLCAVNRVVVLSYQDSASGVMKENDDNSGAFESVELRPIIKISSGSDLAKAESLHHEAHSKCFIANSVNFPVEVKPQITAASAATP